MDKTFDYQVIRECQYEVPIMNSNETTDCDEPATHRVWWEDEDDDMPVCQKHLDFIIACEKEVENG